MTTFEKLSDNIDAGLEDQLRVLGEMVAIPSVSSDPEMHDQMIASAQAVQAYFEELGMEAFVDRADTPDGTPGQPAVIAKGEYVEGRPSVLLYAHHDVQPAGDPAKWSSDPFQMEIRDGRAYGRGTSDDGAGVVVHLGAIKALKDLGDLDVNVTVFVEGEEEVGSPSFSNFLRKHEDLLKADVIVVADSGNWTVDVPGITSSLRGMAKVDVTLRVLDHAVHSGMFGGPVLDAVTLASRLIATLHDGDGNVAVAGLGGNPRAQVDWEESEYRRDASVVDGYVLAGTADLAARIWTMPAINVIGMDATSVKDAANAIIPQCTFRLSMRVVPGTSSDEAIAALARHLEENVPFGAQIEIIARESGPSYVADLEDPTVGLLAQSLEEAWGGPAVAIGQGGSIPFIAEFERVFPDAVVLDTGVEDPATNAHSEDESQSLKVLRNATLAEALLLSKLGSEYSG